MTATASLFEDREQDIRELVRRVKARLPDEAELQPLEQRPQWGDYVMEDGQIIDRRLCTKAGTKRMILLGGSYTNAVPFSARIRDSVIAGTDPGFSAFWGIRAYNVFGLHIQRTHFHSLGRPETWNREGHGVYANLGEHGVLTLTDCHFQNLGGQALQVVWREEETGEGAQPGGQVHAKNLVVEDTGTMVGRRAFAISLLDPGGPMSLANVAIFSTPRYPLIDESWGKAFQSNGGLVLDGDGKTRCPRFDASNLAIIQRGPSHPAILLEGVDEAVLDGVVLRDLGNETGSRPPRPAHVVLDRNCGHVQFLDVVGDVEFYEIANGGRSMVGQIEGSGSFEWTGQGA